MSHSNIHVNFVHIVMPAKAGRGYKHENRIRTFDKEISQP